MIHRIHPVPEIKEKFTKGFIRDVNIIDTIVLHGTGGGGTLNWIKNCNPNSKRGKRYKNGNGLFHYLIERDGKTYCLVDPSRWVYHSSTGHHDRKTIGIELLNPSPGNLLPYTKEQYKSLVFLIDYLKQNFKNIKIIISHNEKKKQFNKHGKVCPGPMFNWKKLKKMLLDKFTFDYINNETFENLELLK